MKELLKNIDDDTEIVTYDLDIGGYLKLWFALAPHCYESKMLIAENSGRFYLKHEKPNPNPKPYTYTVTVYK